MMPEDKIISELEVVYYYQPKYCAPTTALSLMEVMKMREILFRGKTKAITGCPYNNGKPDGEWVFGYVFSDLGAMKIRQYETDRPEYNDYEVDPETVSQYTGLTDKNRTKIFEWDIVKCTDDAGIENIFIIMWDSRRAMFYLDSPTYKTDFYYYSANELEVIGNIYDNPELLGELR